jgi:hypothetical protein
VADLLRLLRFPAAAFLVAAAFVPGIFSSASMPRWWAIAIAVPLCSRMDPRALDPRIAALLAAGLAWCAASLSWSPDPLDGGLNLLMLALLSLAMIAAAGEADVEPAIEAFGWGVGVSALIAVPQSMGWSPVYQITSPAGLFASSEVLAEVAAPVLVWAALRRPHGARITPHWGLVALMLIPLALCHSRIAVAVAAAGLVAGWRPSRSWHRPAALILLSVAAVAAVGLFGAGKMQSGLDRVVLWGAAVQSITPVGRGLGWWAFAHPGSIEEFAHSDALQMMVEVGGGALFFFAVPVLILLRRDAGSTAERAALVTLCIEAVVSFPTHLAAPGFLAAVLAGGMARARRRVRALELAGRIDHGGFGGRAAALP